MIVEYYRPEDIQGDGQAMPYKVVESDDSKQLWDELFDSKDIEWEAL